MPSFHTRWATPALDAGHKPRGRGADRRRRIGCREIARRGTVSEESHRLGDASAQHGYRHGSSTPEVDRRDSRRSSSATCLLEATDEPQRSGHSRTSSFQGPDLSMPPKRTPTPPVFYETPRRRPTRKRGMLSGKLLLSAQRTTLDRTRGVPPRTGRRCRGVGRWPSRRSLDDSASDRDSTSSMTTSTSS